MIAMTPIKMAHILQFFHQNFLFSFPACCSNCEAPCCKASARSSRSDSFWSRSKTFSTLTRIMPTTWAQQRKSATPPMQTQTPWFEISKITQTKASTIFICKAWGRKIMPHVIMHQPLAAARTLLGVDEEKNISLVQFPGNWLSWLPLTTGGGAGYMHFCSSSHHRY